MKTKQVCFKIKSLSRYLSLSIGSFLTLLISVTSHANPEQNAALVDQAKASRACENVTVAVTCYGDESCGEAIRQKREALTGFSAAGVHVDAIFNPWKMVLRKNEKLNEMVLVPYSERAHKMRAIRPQVTYHHPSDLACANLLALALSLSGGEGLYPQVPALIPTVLSSLEAPQGYILYSWANPQLFGPR